MLRIDLRTAAIPFKITGHEGEEARDFHALRNCTISNVIRADSKRAMTLARHSDPKLTTARYARTRLHDLGSLVNKLPGSKGPEAERLRMTGTDGDTAASDKRNTISGAANGGNGRLRLRMNEETEVMEPTATGSLNRLISNGNEGVLGCVGKEEDERKAKPPARLELATYALRKCGSDSVSAESTSDNGEVDSAGAATGAAEPQTLPPELVKIVAAWPTLPDALRRAMLALVDAG